MKKSYAFALTGVAMVTAVIMNAETSGINWKPAGDALAEAPKSNKKVVLDVFTDWCGWCKRMDRDTYADKGVGDYMASHYIAGKLNPERDGKVTYQGKEYSLREFGAALGINGYPATVFFSEKGEVLTVVSGYIEASRFLRILHYFGEDAYKSIKWDDYQNSEAKP